MPLLLLLFLALATTAEDELFIESTAEGAGRMNIAVIPFAPKAPGGAKTSDELWTVVKSDLKFSGRFNVFDATTADTAFFKANGISVFVSGAYSASDGKVIADYTLADAFSLNPIAVKQYSAAQGNLRRAAHLFSDEVVYRLFGEKGIASTRIVALQKKGNAKEVVLLDYDGHNLTRLTSNNKLNLTPAWSPDNQAIVYTSYRQETPAIFVSWIYTGKTERLTPNPQLNFSPSWNGVEDKIAFASSVSGDCRIFVMDRDGSNVRQLTYRPGCIESSPCYSPNGYEICFTSDRTGNPQVYIMDNEGANQRRLTFEGKYNDQPAWSPKGDRIAYASLEPGGFNLFTIAADGSDVKRLTEKAGGNEHPAWSPDGRLLVFISTRTGGSDLYLMNDDGTEQTRITFTGDLYSPEWSGFSTP